ncbi:MAG: hypothetical protein RL758_2030 [Pseudomonadota bacterium]|jgi:hypothetical protein
MNRIRMPLARHGAAWVCLALLAGCAGKPVEHRDEASFRLQAVALSQQTHLSEPAADEVVVVINHNADLGNHTGVWVGNFLADPAGSYISLRSRGPNWSGPSLSDYVRFQMEDGHRVLVYRFRLKPHEFAQIRQRVVTAGPTAPLYCAAAVQNFIAGIGPFAAIKPVNWTSPADLARELLPLWQGNAPHGACLWPDGEPCAVARR